MAFTITLGPYDRAVTIDLSLRTGFAHVRKSIAEGRTAKLAVKAAVNVTSVTTAETATRTLTIKVKRPK